TVSCKANDCLYYHHRLYHRGSHLQVIQELNVAHKTFVVDIPAQTTGRKEPKPVAFPKFLGTVVRTGILQYVPLVVVVCTTEYPIFTGMRNYTSCRILSAIQKPHLGELVLFTQGKFVVKLQLVI